MRRHPHVFGDAEARTPGRVRERWEALKTEQEGREGIFHDVPEALPALLQSRKVQRRAAVVGYDWPDLAGPLAKVREELAELEEASARAGEPAPETEPDRDVFHELGDVLFTVVNVARRLNVDPELALRATTRRFTARVETAADLAESEGVDWRTLGLDAQDAYYERAKETLGMTTARLRLSSLMCRRPAHERDRPGTRTPAPRLAGEPDARGRRHARVGRSRPRDRPVGCLHGRARGGGAPRRRSGGVPGQRRAEGRGTREPARSRLRSSAAMSAISAGSTRP